MAQNKSRTALLATLEYPVEVEIRAAEFEAYSSLRYLDVSRLRKGNHRRLRSIWQAPIVSIFSSSSLRLELCSPEEKRACRMASSLSTRGDSPPDSRDRD